MGSGLVVAGLVVSALAAALHVYIFALESLLWTTPRARATFGTGSVEQAEATRPMAFNQGFYNLFLAVAVFLGVAFVAAGRTEVGATLVLVGAGSMLAAASVLLLSSRALRAAALKQGTLPLVGVLLLAVGLLV